jgi:hypothetical protein
VISHFDRRRNFYYAANHWPAWRDLSLPGTIIEEIADDIMAKISLGGPLVYSSVRSGDLSMLADRLGLSADRKLLVAYTSSLDEYQAGVASLRAFGFEPPVKPQPFRDQIEWLKSLCDYVGSHRSLQLVVRIHPREGGNQFDARSSQHLKKLREAFSKRHTSCHFFWPEDKISSYDLAELADLVLISWSNIGLELARLGCPVLSSTNGMIPFPHDDFMEFGHTSDLYFSKLEELLRMPPRIEPVLHAFRWYHLHQLGSSISIGDVRSNPRETGIPPFRVPREAETLEQVVVHERSLLDINEKRLLAIQNTTIKEIERKTLCEQLSRILDLLTGPLLGADLSRMASRIETILQAEGFEQVEKTSRFKAYGRDLVLGVR